MSNDVCCICGKHNAYHFSCAQDGTEVRFHLSCYLKLCTRNHSSTLHKIKRKRKVNKEGAT